MEIRSIYNIRNVDPFIEFEASIGNERLQLEGHEYYCIDPTCNCSLVNIMVHEARSGGRLTQLIYGWRPYKHYRKQNFLKAIANQ